MKIAIILEEKVCSGGGYFQSLNTVKSFYKSASKENQVIVFTTLKANKDFLRELNITTKIFRKSFLDYFYLYVHNLWLYKFIQLVINKNLTSFFEKKLIFEKIDFVVFTSPSSLTPLLLNKINFSLSIWDNSHLEFPEFPEVRGKVFTNREFFLNISLPLAYFIIVDSSELAYKLSDRYRIDLSRFIILPFYISPMLKDDLNGFKGDVCNFDALNCKYIFYPAQFWPHKNHISILEAILLLKSYNKDYHVVFCGRNYSSKENIRKYINENNLVSNVTMLNYVSNDELIYLYKNCEGVIMTTYFGPTNIPPIEAWYFKKPLIYSKHLGSQVGEAAILVDCDDYKDIAEGILKLKNEVLVSKIILEGSKKLINVEDEILKGEKEVAMRFHIFNRRKNNWN